MSKKIKLPKRIDARALKKISKNAGKQVLKYFKENFNKQGFDDNNGNFERWADRKEKKRKSLLVDSGRLKKSFKLKVRKNSFEIENVAPYARYQHYGTDDIEARPIVYDNDDTDKIILKAIDKEVFKLLGF